MSNGNSLATPKLSQPSKKGSESPIWRWLGQLMTVMAVLAVAGPLVFYRS